MANAGVKYSRFYYDDAYDALLKLKREIAPWHTDNDPYDPVMLLLDAMAWHAHRDACAIDATAEGLFWDSFATRPSAIALGALIDYHLNRESPATAIQTGYFNPTNSYPLTVVQTGAIVATSQDPDNPSVEFEYLDDDLDVGGTALVLRTWDNDLALYANFAGLGVPFTANVQVNDAIYIGVEDAMCEHLALTFNVASHVDINYSIEYLDEGFSGEPDTVAFPGPGLSFTAPTFLHGLSVFPLSFAGGLGVTVTYVPTGATEDAIVASDHETILLTGPLGQAAPSLVSGDYLVTTTWTKWRVLAGEIDGLSQTLRFDGTIDNSLPQGLGRRWVKTTIDGVEAYWMRIRVASVVGVPPAINYPDIATLTNTNSNFFVDFEVTQGSTTNQNVGTSDGSSGQQFQLTNTPYIQSSVSEVAVNLDTDWSLAEGNSFFFEDANSKVYRIVEDEDENIFIVFGDGSNGQIPTSGDAIRVTYRVGADLDGNVGADTITNVRSGINGLVITSNTQAASGWAPRDGHDDADLERVRTSGPASLRALGRAVTIPDFETLAVSEFVDSDGGRPVARAIAVEDGAGPKTVQLVCSGPGGALLTASQLADLEEYFNGTTIDLQRFGGVGAVNTETDAVNYTPLPVAVTATITMQAGYTAGVQARIEAALQSILAPDATNATWKTAAGLTGSITQADYAFLWRRGGSVTTGRLNQVIHSSAGDGLVDVVLAVPAANIVLAGNELPVPGVLTITVTT